MKPVLPDIFEQTFKCTMAYTDGISWEHKTGIPERERVRQAPEMNSEESVKRKKAGLRE